VNNIQNIQNTIILEVLLNLRAIFVIVYIGKGLPQQAQVTQGVLGRLRPQIFLTFGTTRVVGRQPYAPAAFTSGEIIFRG
jgi:hypothetical protein